MRWKIKCTILLYILNDIILLKLIHVSQYETKTKTEFSLKVN